MRKRDHKREKTNKLVVKKETLRQLRTLGDEDLRGVAGGFAPSHMTCRDP